MHCSKPPCLNVCPTKATYRRPDGIVGISYEKCIGCGYCIIACPYRARTIFTREFDFEVRNSSSDPVRVRDERVGICTKCDFCLSRIDFGLAQGKKPGIDPEATPVCVITCSSNAISFGDLNDSNSNAAKLLKENSSAILQEQLGTEPSVYFIIYEGFFRDENKK
jgi:phenylacetyl-CoA:acceptor oxidoreductase subunit 1